MRSIHGAELVLRPARMLRQFVNSSPWFTISGLVHVILITVLGVVCFRHERAAARTDGVLQMSAARMPSIEPLPARSEPEILKRENLPAVPDRIDVGDTPNHFVPDSLPGLKGEEIPLQDDPTRDAGAVNPDPDALTTLPSGAPGGTAIGVGINGHRSLQTSPWSTRWLGPGGRGKGGKGENGEGGPPHRVQDVGDRAVLASLRWLAKHQSSDGRWDCDGFDAQCTLDKCDGRGEATYDPGVTGLALLCFLGAGFTPENGEYKKVVKEGLNYLKSIQTEDGLFGPQTSQHYQYNHACAALAMAEAFGMTQATAFEDCAQRGVQWVLRSQNPYLAWRYGIADGDNDTSVTGWMSMVLKSATLAGLQTEKQSLHSAAHFVDQMTDPMTGRTGYQQRGGLPARAAGPSMEHFPAEKSESLTAVGMLVRIFDGHRREDDAQILKGAELLLQRLPRWDDGSIDFYYWYYGSLAMFQVGGEPWKKWNDAMKLAILDHQRLDPKQDAYGSWDPVDPWSQEGGRVYSTALLGLCMEVYYRYDRVFGVKDESAPEPPKKKSY